MQILGYWKHIIFREKVRLFCFTLTADRFIFSIYQILVNLFVVFIVHAAFEDFQLVQEQLLFVILHIIGSGQCCIVESIQRILVQLRHLNGVSKRPLVHRIDCGVSR
ncbi:hypothetical protein D3C74_357660 [compost metagenome]